MAPKDISGEVIPDLSIPTLFNVKGKVALVTGGGSGIGKMIAEALVANGARVYIASRKQKVLEEVVNEINSAEGATGECRYLVANLAGKADCYKLADDLRKAGESKLHILVANSGITWGAPLEDFPEKEGWDNLFNLNVKSMFYLTTACLPLLEAAGKEGGTTDPARVINITSVAGVSSVISGLGAGGTVTPSYAATKAAGNHLTRVMSGQLIKRNILVNAIAPGLFASRMSAFAIKTSMDALVKGQPTGRIGSDTDMAGLALFLCSRASAHITGNVVTIDGGTSINTAAYSRL
ncbi:putative NADPH-dependent beta-ketoacyl reductase [Hyaloraphidium curvatum]|nr:putative NADPH-dependent beta-ketoacyl reductase [Hyaloraphidium curvatum]